MVYATIKPIIYLVLRSGNMRLFVCGAGSVIIVLVCAQVCLAGGASFRGLGDLPGGDYYSRAFGVSAYGNAVVGMSSTSSGYEAFIWTDTNGMVGLGRLEGDCRDSEAYGVSCDGSFVVGSSSIRHPIYLDCMPVSCRWSGPNDILRLSQEEEWGAAIKISADGSTVVGLSDSVPYGGFRWTESAGMQSLGCLPGKSCSEAIGVSADGHVIVGDCQGPGNIEAFLWTENTGMVGLGNLPEVNNSGAYDVSEDGLVVVGSSGGQAFIWTEAEGMRGLGVGIGSCALAVSGDGAIVVGQLSGGIFIWDANHGMQNLKNVLENAYGLNLTGWQLDIEADISADGRTIVGSGTDPNGNMQAWIAVLETPPPSVRLTVQAEPNDLGIDTLTPSIGEHIYYKNWPVVVKADTFKKCPDVYRFNHWTGDMTEPNSATITLVMTEDKTVTAVYYVDQRRCGDECHPILQGDLNNDCYINFEDFAIYCELWLSCTHPDCD
ncbi:MAG: PEP-CTERM sorting domain-containing protein [Planctomycetota bacterium]